MTNIVDMIGVFNVVTNLVVKDTRRIDEAGL